ncbi:SET domain-containing protein 3, partial [Massospora cicadina]
DDGFTIQCDSCFVWQHAECVGIEEDQVPELYRCELCDPRELDIERAFRIQNKKFGGSTRKPKHSKGKRPMEPPTQSSSAAASPSATASVRSGRKRARRRSEAESPGDGISNHSPSTPAPVHDVEDLMTKICQGLLTSKTSKRKKPSAPSASPPQPLEALKYTLCPSTSTFEADPSDVLVRAIEGLSRKRFGRRGCEGLFSCSRVAAGQFIVEITGKVILRSKYTQDSDNLFNLVGTVLPDVVLHRSLNLAVDCREQPCLACHIRRHCMPNAELRSFFVAGVDTDVVHLGVFSTAIIEPGQEILLPWTLSADLLPEGVGSDDEGSKRMIAKAFYRAYSLAGRTLTQDQAKRVIHCLRQDSCPCNRDPPCALNIFFRVRKLFWSRQKLAALAGVEHATPAPLTSVAATEERKPLSGSEVERDPPADLPLACRRATAELTPLEENSSPSNLQPDASLTHQSGELQAPDLPSASDTPLAPDVTPSDARPTSPPSVPPLVKSCQPSSPAAISKSPASPALPALPSTTLARGFTQRVDLMRSMSLVKYFMARYNSEHGIKPKGVDDARENEAALRPSSPRLTTQSEPRSQASPLQVTPASTPQAALEVEVVSVAVPDTVSPVTQRKPSSGARPSPASHAKKVSSPVERHGSRSNSPVGRPPSRLTPRKGHRLSWKQFVIDSKAESQPPPPLKQLSNHRVANGRSDGTPNGKINSQSDGPPISFASSRRANGPPRPSRSPSPQQARARLKARSFGRSSAVPHSEAEEGELSNETDSPLPDHPIGGHQYFAPSDRSHPTRHPSLDFKDSRQLERQHYVYGDRFGQSNGYPFGRHANARDLADRSHREPMRSRLGPRYLPPNLASDYRNEGREAYYGHYRDRELNHRRERGWNVDSPLGYQSPVTNPGTPRSELPHHGTYGGGGHGPSQSYRSNGSSFYPNPRGVAQPQPPAQPHYAAPLTRPLSRPPVTRSPRLPSVLTPHFAPRYTLPIK